MPHPFVAPCIPMENSSCRKRSTLNTSVSFLSRHCALALLVRLMASFLEHAIPLGSSENRSFYGGAKVRSIASSSGGTRTRRKLYDMLLLVSDEPYLALSLTSCASACTEVRMLTLVNTMLRVLRMPRLKKRQDSHVC